MKGVILTILFLSYSSAHASDMYVKCNFSQQIITAGPKETLDAEISSSLDENGNGLIDERFGFSYILVKVKNFTSLSMEISDHGDLIKKKKEITLGKTTTLTLAEAKGRSFDGRTFHGLSLACKTVAY